MTTRHIKISKRTGWVLTAVTAVCVATATSLVAQREAAQPNPLGQPLLDSRGFVRDDAMIRTPLLPEDRQYADLDGPHMKDVVNQIVGISLKDRDSGALFWGRNMGFPGHDAMLNWVDAYFRKYNLTNIRRKSFDLQPQWIPKSYDMTFTSGGKTFNLKTARPAKGTSSTPPSGVEWDLVWAATGTAADFAGRDVKGKAVLIQDIPMPGTIRHTITGEDAVKRAFDNGAAAVAVMYGIADNMIVWEGNDEKPGFVVGYEDGKVLRDLLGRGQNVRVKYRLDSEMRSGMKSASILGTLPGATDEEVLVIAHIDGFFQGALDNASGVSVMMGLLEHYSKIPQAQRRRTIRFLGSVGHHSTAGGADGPGTRWLHDARATELAKTVLAINLEHVAAVRTKYWGPKLRMTTAVSPMRWWVYGSPKVMNTALHSFSHFNVGITADMDPNASGEMGSMARDVPSIQVITSPEIKHAEDDTPEWVPSAGLENIARAYAKIIDEVNKLDKKDIVPASIATH
jgi:hypothetical protein